MPRPKRARRFEPRYGVSQLTIETEAGYIAREVDDYAVLSPSDVQTKVVERHASCEDSWKHLNLLLTSLPENKRQIIHALIFRDFYYLVELYLAHVRAAHPATLNASRPPATHVDDASAKFSEWLFNVNKGKE